MFRLMSNVAPKAVRDKFNHYYNPLALSATLARDKALITSRLLNCRIINKKQMDLLYPTSGITSSENYDITLMICLLRNMTTIVPPLHGYDKLPPVTEVSDGADLARIKYYRNVLAHTDNGQLSNEHFNTMWICVSEAIISLGGMTYKPKCEELSQINLNKDILTYIRQDLSEFREEIYDQIETLKKQTVSNKTSVTLLQAQTSNIHSEFSIQGNICPTLKMIALIVLTALYCL
ncbi:uncharacterized protein LOC127713981 [Mytilus californianus]|uniref:uncharacterized protein LOC127713981 n=1 Tax=Mytilus californianus TaxID=6549 RepID=UPI002247FBB8|nr:uncharacterized protein LOC127713981 [Mytilus californianus]